MSAAAPPGRTLTAPEREARDLACSLSLAARIDIPLIRIFRRELHPALPASAEAVLWFGPLVSRRGGGTITLEAEALPQLRSQLLGRSPEHPACAPTAHGLLEQVRKAEGAPRYLRLEEELIWLGLRGAAREAVDTCLGEVFRDIRTRGPAMARDIARWVTRAFPRLPQEIMNTRAGWLLWTYASASSGFPLPVSPPKPPDAETARLLAWVSPEETKIPVGARAVGGMVELSCPPVPGSHRFKAPGSDPIVIDILAPGLFSGPGAADGHDDAPASSDRRPQAVVAVPNVPGAAELARQAADLLDEHGFAAAPLPIGTDIGALPPDATVLLIWDSGAETAGTATERAADPAGFLSQLVGAEVLTVVVRPELLDAACGTADTGAGAAARVKLLDLFASVLARKTPRALAAVPRDGHVAIPAEGPVWLRAPGEPWHVLRPLLPDGVHRLRATDPRAVGPHPLLGYIASSGLGSLYLARAADGRRAAAKVVEARFAADFAREFRRIQPRWARISDERVATFIAAGLDEPSPYILMEFLDGARLDRSVSPDHPLSGRELTRFAYQLAHALDAVHKAELVHGHLLPGAVLLGPSGFKLSRLHSARLIGDTRPSALEEVRNPHVRPEAAVGRPPALPSADIHGWGSLVYYAATGYHAYDPNRAPFTFPPDLADLALLVQEALSAEPSARPTAAHLVERLRPTAAEPADPAMPADRSGTDVSAWQGRVGLSFLFPPYSGGRLVIDGRVDTPMDATVRAGTITARAAIPSPTVVSSEQAEEDARDRTTEFTENDRIALVRELANTLPDQEAANRLLREMGIPLSHVPTFGRRSPIEAWQEISLLLDRGIIADSYPRLVEAMLRRYPGNATLRAIAERHHITLGATSTRAEPRRVFLSHAGEDTDAARDLFRRLAKAGFTPWLDVEDIVPGQNWVREIDRALRDSWAFLILLSKAAVTRRGFIEPEIQGALNLLTRRPPGERYVIPVLLEPCRVPKELEQLYPVEIFDSNGHQRLIRMLRDRLPKTAGR